MSLDLAGKAINHTFDRMSLFLDRTKPWRTDILHDFCSTLHSSDVFIHLVDSNSLFVLSECEYILESPVINLTEVLKMHFKRDLPDFVKVARVGDRGHQGLPSHLQDFGAVVHREVTVQDVFEAASIRGPVGQRVILGGV